MCRGLKAEMTLLEMVEIGRNGVKMFQEMIWMFSVGFLSCKPFLYD